MLLKEWDQLGIQTDKGFDLRITGYCMPIDGGGRMPVTAFMPVFRSFEHAEAARGAATWVPIYEIETAEEPPPGWTPDTDPNDPYDPHGAPACQ